MFFFLSALQVQRREDDRQSSCAPDRLLCARVVENGLKSVVSVPCIFCVVTKKLYIYFSTDNNNNNVINDATVLSRKSGSFSSLSEAVLKREELLP